MTRSPPRPSIPALILLLWRLRLARFLLWLGCVTDSYQGVHVHIARQLIEAVERGHHWQARMTEADWLAGAWHAKIAVDQH